MVGEQHLTAAGNAFETLGAILVEAVMLSPKIGAQLTFLRCRSTGAQQHDCE
jgi:hypothetical protein